jgi:hypothetical protein
MHLTQLRTGPSWSPFVAGLLAVCLVNVLGHPNASTRASSVLFPQQRRTGHESEKASGNSLGSAGAFRPIVALKNAAFDHFPGIARSV